MKLLLLLSALLGLSAAYMYTGASEDSDQGLYYTQEEVDTYEALPRESKDLYEAEEVEDDDDDDDDDEGDVAGYDTSEHSLSRRSAEPFFFGKRGNRGGGGYGRSRGKKSRGRGGKKSRGRGGYGRSSRGGKKRGGGGGNFLSRIFGKKKGGRRGKSGGRGGGYGHGRGGGGGRRGGLFGLFG